MDPFYGSFLRILFIARVAATSDAMHVLSPPKHSPRFHQMPLKCHGIPDSRESDMMVTVLETLLELLEIIILVYGVVDDES